MTTPNMGLIEPTPGTGGTPGPQWASEVNDNMETIDEHDHTPGKGAPIGSSAITINADLPFNGFSATDLLSSQYQSQGAASAFPASVQVVNGELTYVDSLGQIVAITANGSVAGAVGSIAGLTSPASAVYSSVTKSFTWSYDSGKAARMANADLIVYPYDGTTAYVNSITIKSPTALAASYSLTLPLAVATQPNVVSMDGSGVLSVGLAAGSAAAPSMAFAADLNTGFYSPSADIIGITAGGAEVGRFLTATGYRSNVAGSAATPSISWVSDPNTGFYSAGADALGFTTGGTARLFLTTTQLEAAVSGTSAAPFYTFDGDENTGMFRNAADSIGFTTGGTQRLTIGTSLITSTLGYVAPNGSVSSPGFRFTSESDTGFYRQTTDTIGAAIAGANMLNIGPNGLMVGTTSTSSAFKIRMVNLGSDSNTAATKGAASGITPTVVFAVIASLLEPTTNIIYSSGWGNTLGAGVMGRYDLDTDQVLVEWDSLPATSKTVRAMIIYQD